MSFVFQHLALTFVMNDKWWKSRSHSWTCWLFYPMKCKTSVKLFTVSWKLRCFLFPTKDLFKKIVKGFIFAAKTLVGSLRPLWITVALLAFLRDWMGSSIYWAVRMVLYWQWWFWWWWWQIKITVTVKVMRKDHLGNVDQSLCQTRVEPNNILFCWNDWSLGGRGLGGAQEPSSGDDDCD